MGKRPHTAVGLAQLHRKVQVAKGPQVTTGIDPARHSAVALQGLYGQVHGVALADAAQIQPHGAVTLFKPGAVQPPAGARRAQADVKQAVAGQVQRLRRGQHLPCDGTHRQPLADRQRVEKRQVTGGVETRQTGLGVVDSGKAGLQRGACRVSRR